MLIFQEDIAAALCGSPLPGYDYLERINDLFQVYYAVNILYSILLI